MDYTAIFSELEDAERAGNSIRAQCKLLAENLSANESIVRWDTIRVTVPYSGILGFPRSITVVIPDWR